MSENKIIRHARSAARQPSVVAFAKNATTEC